MKSLLMTKVMKSSSKVSEHPMLSSSYSIIMKLKYLILRLFFSFNAFFVFSNLISLIFHDLEPFPPLKLLI